MLEEFLAAIFDFKRNSYLDLLIFKGTPFDAEESSWEIRLKLGSPFGIPLTLKDSSKEISFDMKSASSWEILS